MGSEMCIRDRCSSDLSWSAHFKSVQKVCSKRLYLLRILKNVVPHDELWQVFDAVIVNALMYSIELFGPSVEIRTMIYRLYKRAKQIICSKRCVSFSQTIQRSSKCENFFFVGKNAKVRPSFVSNCSSSKSKRSIYYPLLSNCTCLLYTSPSPRDLSTSRMPSSA